MKKRIALGLILCILLALIATAFAEAAGSPEPVASPEPTAVGRLSGVKIGIDPGHQEHANREQEPIAPNSKKTKDKVASGTQGVKTRVPEYQVNLDVSLQLRDALEALGCEVYMTRETNDVDISNLERAQMMNELNVDLVLRIHCNGSEKKSDQGIGLYVTETGDIAESSLAVAQAMMPELIESTGAHDHGIHRRDSYTGQNWSTVPCVMVEMGYMSNPDEDEKLNDPEYQEKLVQGMVNGICAYFGR